MIKNGLDKLGFKLGLNLNIKTDFIYLNYIKNKAYFLHDKGY